VGYDKAALFFQWTWHTPHVPVEHSAAIWWEGIDGSRLLTAPRNALNLHQWPEDFAGLLDRDDWRRWHAPAIVQWLELMPSPDWMCRSELLIPPMRALQARDDLVLEPGTLSDVLAAAETSDTPVRRYTMDDVFHGMSLGKNGDRLRRFSTLAEQQLLTAETAAALAGLLGRPYAQWDVYPAWELEEAWRELMVAQHHDNDECEALCGHIGLASYRRSIALSGHVMERNLQAICDHAGDTMVFNPLGWARTHYVTIEEVVFATDVPAFGVRHLDSGRLTHLPNPRVTLTKPVLEIESNQLLARLDTRNGTLRLLRQHGGPDVIDHTAQPFALSMWLDGKPVKGRIVKYEKLPRGERFVLRLPKGSDIFVDYTLAPAGDAIDVHIHSEGIARPDGGMHQSLQFSHSVAGSGPLRIVHDHPFGVSETRADGHYRKKYPSGDWMTSPQWYEDVHHPFTGLQFVDLLRDDHGLLVLHDGSPQFFRDGNGASQVLSMYDPWDGSYFHAELNVSLRLVPHGKDMTHAERWRRAQEFTRPCMSMRPSFETAPDNDMDNPPPAPLCGAQCDAPNVVLTAFYREQHVAHTASAAPPLIGPLPGVAYPHIVRLVEMEGRACTATLRFASPLAAAWKTNLLGEIEQTLDVNGNTLRLPLRAHEVATLYLDLIDGRKQPRNLDAHRGVWATSHRRAG
jgi:alpha-mannosidase